MSGTGTFENRYKVLSPESDGEMWQEVSNSKGKHKRVRRSTVGYLRPPRSTWRPGTESQRSNCVVPKDEQR